VDFGDSEKRMKLPRKFKTRLTFSDLLDEYGEVYQYDYLFLNTFFEFSFCNAEFLRNDMLILHHETYK